MTDTATSDTVNSAALPPYTAFQSFKTGLSVFKDHVIPERVDKSVWKNKFSGAVSTQVFTALKFLNLIDGEGVPSDQMRALVAALNTDKWGDELRKVLKGAYVPVFEMDLEKVTASQFFERFRTAYKAEGETGRKCVTFFLNAAREASIPVSPFLMANAKPRAAANGSTKRKPKAKITEASADSGAGSSPPPPPPPPPAPPPPPMTEKALEYRLVDLMREAAGDDPDVMAAIVKVMTWLQTRQSKG